MLITREILQQLPKSELHLHLRGAMPPEVLVELLEKYSLETFLQHIPACYRTNFLSYPNLRQFLSSQQWTLAAVERLFSIQSFSQFLATYSCLGHFIRDISDLRRLIIGVLRQLKAQNIVYAEITISPYGYMERGISLPEIHACLDEAANFPGIQVQWIIDLLRDLGKDGTFDLLKQILALHCESVTGITLGGREHLFPPEDFREVYALARDHGLRLTIHAGEVLGPQSVWDAIQVLGVERIGHGVRAVEDPTLMNYLQKHQIPLEICPTSNIRTGLSLSYQAHPIHKLLQAGIPATINTDDPTFFGTTLSDEYLHLYTSGIREHVIYEMLKNGFLYAFLPENTKKAYLRNFEHAWTRYVIFPYHSPSHSTHLFPEYSKLLSASMPICQPIF